MGFLEQQILRGQKWYSINHMFPFKPTPNQAEDIQAFLDSQEKPKIKPISKEKIKELESKLPKDFKEVK